MKSLLLFLLLVISLRVPAQSFSFVFLHKNPAAPVLPKPEAEALMKGHMANMERLAKEGKLLAAGPFEGGGGIFIFRSATPAEIAEWTQLDPGIQAKRWNLELLTYQPSHGSVCLVNEPYTMVEYTLVYLRSDVRKFNVQQATATVGQHQQFVKQLAATGNLVAAGLFVELDGAVVVMKGAVDENMFLEDPAVKEALFLPDIKKLYIAQGAFCEK